MKPDFRKSMIWLHTYSGLVIGWLLFTIFLTGTLSYFNPEITQWMKPELVQVSSTQNMVNRSLDVLHKEGTDSDRWRINLPDKRTEHWSIQWSKGRDRQNLSLGPDEGQVVTPRESAGGNFFRVFHYTLELRGYGGRYISGIAAMFMLIAVFSGIFTHRRFFRDFFTLRFNKVGKALTDFHALAGVTTIPFCIMICSSGIMIYNIMYMPFSANYYAGGERALSRQLAPNLAPHLAPNLPSIESSSNAVSEMPLPLKDFAVVQQQVQQTWTGEDQIRRITFEQPFSQNGRIIVDRVKDNTLSRQSERLVFSSHTGEALEGYQPASTATEVRRVFFGLHEGHFADTGLRWLLFLLGLLSSALIATGLIIWLKKRKEKHQGFHLGYFIVERLNISGIAGLLVATTAFFLANRLLPIEIANRANMEVHVFLWTWLICLIHALLRPANKAWFEQLLISAVGCILLPFVDVMQNSQWLVNAIIQTNVTYLGVTVAMFIIGIILLKTALWLKVRTSVNYLKVEAKSC
ncbi:PepSY-associated TM helix domain-containing protein [uncultured Psychrosphaera sp.]|uniref:PepSY-associated TM helix domain-containing protein n=1 Tax=uncultured Psychrosphaera sp. TaxID=1403522 RepID=UPI002608B197|nr:PepSY-associated TM helix domain-containing protein [uncultured Psychrosphaera sp.]